MGYLQWNTSHAVFVTAIDDEHKEIFDAVSKLQMALAGVDPPSQIMTLAKCVGTRIADHFAHEERLMRAARYSSLTWHKRQHENARKRVVQFVLGIEKGEPGAASGLVEYLTSWFDGHAHLADQMLGAALRNHARGLYKLTIQAGTKPVDACTWKDVNGDTFDVPRA